MSLLRINDEAPDFTADTTHGPIQFHQWIGDNWAVLFSHPKDFTPVCTTELGAMAGLEGVFAKRGAKIIGLSVDPVENHARWAVDIQDVTGNTINYPMIGDVDLKVAKLYNMLPADETGSCEGRTPATNAAVRTVFVIGPDIVDPQPDIHRYLVDAGKFGLEIRHVFLTHFHADFVAGHLELRDRCDATIRLGARAKAEYAFASMKDGDTLEFPGLRVQVLETPGHTIESISILVFDLEKDPAKPHAVLTGDTLFIGDVGRPDLRASLGWTANSLAAHLYASLRDKLLTLPDETLVYPAHGAGSLCGKQLSSDTVSSIGDQRRFNYALQPMSEEVFVRLVTADLPDAPPYFTYDAILNTRERATLDKNLEEALHPVELDEVIRPGDGGAQILDVRDAAEYAKGHLAGSINIGLGGQYATWAGTVLDRAEPIVIIAEPGRELEAALRRGRIGFDNVRGYLRGGMQALAERPDLVCQTERVSAQMVADELAGAEPPLVLDIRNAREWATKHIARSMNIPLNHLQERIAEVPRERRIAAYCASGYRSSIAASILHHYGITNLIEMAGGLAAWDAAKLPVVSEA